MVELMALISQYVALECGKTDKLTEKDMAATVLA
jgi:hypothetical protein